jgi:hypothetical protein
MKDSSARVIFAKEIEAHRLAKRQPNRKVTNEFHFGNGSREHVTYGSHHDTGSDTRALRVGTDGSGQTPGLRGPSRPKIGEGYNVARFSDMKESKVGQKNGDSPCEIEEADLV